MRRELYLPLSHITIALSRKRYEKRYELVRRIGKC